MQVIESSPLLKFLIIVILILFFASLFKLGVKKVSGDSDGQEKASHSARIFALLLLIILGSTWMLEMFFNGLKP